MENEEEENEEDFSSKIFALNHLGAVVVVVYVCQEMKIKSWCKKEDGLAGLVFDDKAKGREGRAGEGKGKGMGFWSPATTN